MHFHFVLGKAQDAVKLQPTTLNWPRWVQSLSSLSTLFHQPHIRNCIMLDNGYFKTKAPYPLVFFFLPLFFSSSPVSLCSSQPDGSLLLCKHVRKVEASFSVCSRRVQYIIMESHLEKRRPWSNCNKACWTKITLSINLTVKILSTPFPHRLIYFKLV